MELVTKKEAARRLGVSIDTIERRLQSGELKGQKQPRPQGYTWLIELPENSREANERQASPQEEAVGTQVCICACTGEIHRLDELVAALQSQIATQQKQMEEQLATHQEQLQAKDRQIGELHILLQQAQKALPAPKEDRQSWWHRLWQRQR